MLTQTVIRFFTICSCSFLATAILPTVTVKNGTLEGAVARTRRGRDILAFRGIPYAAPLIGDLRFEPPRPARRWSGTRSAREDAPACIQKNFANPALKVEGEEDCLYLNVYTPSLPSDNSSKYPVMVFFHGGGWFNGTGDSRWYGPEFLLDHDVVLVTMNYRLGALGLLSTADNAIPGNQAMKDHVQSLRWVQENIAVFGGDPSSVTIFGESAGGVSVNYLMMSPLARGLFHRAISQSGTALNPWAFNSAKVAKKHTNRLAQELNCPTNASLDLLKCLQQKPAVDIVMADINWAVFGEHPMMPFRPVVEPDHPGAFLTVTPEELIKHGNVSEVPWMVGINAHEGAMSSAPIYASRNQEDVKKFDEQFSELAPISFLYSGGCPKAIENEVTEKIREFYLGHKRIDESTKSNVTDMFSDALYNVGTAMAVNEYLRDMESPVYYYQFAYRGSFSWSGVFDDISKDYGVSHADELLYLFPMNEVLFPNTSLSKEDHEVIDVMTSLWTNFAKTGDPVPQTTPKIPVKWQPVTTEALEYLAIKNGSILEMSKDLFKERLTFWETLPCHAGLVQSSNSFDSEH